MHNLDRTMYEAGTGETRPDSEHEDFLGILGSLLSGETPDRMMAGETLGELESAAALLEVRDEAELDRFIGNLFSSAVGAARDFASSPTGQALGGIVKKAAKQALPVVGRGVGGWISPQFAEPGARVGNAVGDLLGLELEGLSGEDREFEIARALIRFAQAACRHAMQAAAAAPAQPPAVVARKAAVAAAREHAPGLAQALTSPAATANGGATHDPRTDAPAAGRWYRRGNTILILNP